jgi:hypothetical protein
MLETSPIVPDYVIVEFKSTFNKALNTDDPTKFIFQPEICDKLVPTKENINKWNKPTNNLNDLKKKTETQKTKKIEEDKKKIREWCELFASYNKRYPTDEEILDQLKDKFDVLTIEHSIKENKV